MTAAVQPPPTVDLPAITVGPRNAYTDPASGLRFYRWQGRDLPSVTSIRRMAGIPHGLHQWALGKVIDRVLDDFPKIRTLVESGDAGNVKLVRTHLRAGATEERDAAAKLGTAVHDAAATGRALSDVPPNVAPRLRQYMDWLEVSGAEVLASEFQCWNLAVGYAGTADLLVRLRDGSVWLVDLKTGKGVYGDHALQLIAYLRAEFVGSDNVVDSATTALLHEARGMAVLHLADKGWEFRSLTADAATWNAFRGLLLFADWTAGHASADSITLASRASAVAP